MMQTRHDERPGSKEFAPKHAIGGGPEIRSAGKPRIPALTGLRGVAVLMVVIGHAAPGVVSPPYPGSHTLSHLAPTGMSLFFTLSGYVIWLNYAESFSIRATGIALRDFAVARFARLWPMYVVALAIAVVLSHPHVVPPVMRNLILNSLLLQAWIPADGGTLLLASVPAGQHFWSISAELFFYIVFPLFALALGRLKHFPTILFFALANAIVFAALYAFVMENSSTIMRALSPALPESEAVMWLSYYSPFTRLFEFIGGALACHLFLEIRSRKPSPREEGAARALACVALVAIVAMPFLFQFGSGLSEFYRAFDVMLRALPVLPMSYLLFHASRYRRALGTLLDWWPIVAIGELSYSMYLLHPFVIGIIAVKVVPWTGLGALPYDARFWSILLLTVFAVIAVSAITFGVVERPARQWLRGKLSSKGARARQ
jgi:peptidoglycan/LPS O-acetylase OafA/YrhL